MPLRGKSCIPDKKRKIVDNVNMLKKNWKIILILILALFFRLVLTPIATNGDLLTQAEWGKWEYANGVKGLYEHNQWLNEWPNHPPLISGFYWWVYKSHSLLMKLFSDTGNFIALNRLAPTKFLWFFDFTKWFGLATYENANYLKGIVVTTKLYMILADFLIAGVIYLFCKKIGTDWRKYVLSYLILPFSWYLSACWGQSDQLAFLFLIISFLILNSKWFWWSPIIFAISINLKPTGLILVPLFLFIWYKQKKSIKSLVLSIIVSILLTLLITSFFTNQNPLYFSTHDLWKRLFLTKTPFTTISAFNFWYIFHAKDLVSETTKYLFLSAKNWGYFLFFVVSTISFIQIKYRKMETFFAAMFISSFGAWLFTTNMYERYLFPGLLSLFFLSIYRKKLFKYFVILSIIYLFNMYNGWWFPQNWIWLKELFLWKGRLLTRIFSITNVLIYVYIVYSMKNDYWPSIKTFFKKIC